jgi:hypothetical protein
MFGTLTHELFPNECRVLEIVPDTQYVYPIYKNGSTSLKETGYPEISLEKLSTLKNVEVYVRDPHQRFVAGVQTYIEKMGNVDINTALHFVEKYLYLNRHFCPQLFWLINFKRFSDATITIKPLAEICKITQLESNQSTRNSEIVQRFANSAKVRFYNEIDEVLTVNLLGKTVEFAEIIAVLKQNYSELYNESFFYPKKIFDVVS